MYSNRQNILLVGEGDFTFSLALASVIGGSKLVCTSLDKLSQMQVHPFSQIDILSDDSLHLKAAVMLIYLI